MPRTNAPSDCSTASSWSAQSATVTPTFENGRAPAEEHSWGLIERYPDDGHLMGFEIWEASKRLPAAMVAALPIAGKPHGVAA